MEKQTVPDAPDSLGGFRPTYGVELLYVSSPTIRKSELLLALRTRCDDAAPLDGNEEGGLLAFVFPKHPVMLKDATLPAQVFVAVSEEMSSGPSITAALQQSWSFPNAKAVVDRCATSVLITDLMSASLPYRERIDLFEAALLSLLEVSPPDALHWVPAQRVVEPSQYVESSRVSRASAFFAGPVNVRFFNVSGSTGEMVADTMGLAAIGLPDLQCHFRALEPNAVVRVLYNLAFYLFEHGDVIQDGHTVDGVHANSKWKCRHEESLIGPARGVLDLNPGAPFAGVPVTNRWHGLTAARD